VVGELTLSYNRLDLAADHGLAIFTCAAEPGSRSEEALMLLGSWSATLSLRRRAHPTKAEPRYARSTAMPSAWASVLSLLEESGIKTTL